MERAYSTVDVEPTCFSQAIKYSHWRLAMASELDALAQNNTWELVPPPSDAHIVGAKWLLKLKSKPDSSIDRQKARLVEKGYTQQEGIDYDETFAPVAKMRTGRTQVSLAVNNGWQLHQLDVKNAFFHGDLLEEVYPEIPPPPGFGTNQTVGKVCKLKKSLYGLKQSPRARFARFRRAMVGMGYQQINADHTVFFRQHRRNT